MSLHRVCVAMACAALMSATPAYPVDDVLSGADLYRYCSEHNNSNRDIGCQYYIAGVMGGMIVAEEVQRKICLPQTPNPKVSAIDPSTMRQVVEKFLRDNPALLTQGAEKLVARAFYDAFPCK